MQVYFTVNRMEEAMAQLRDATKPLPGAYLAPVRDEDGKVRVGTTHLNNT